MIQKREEILLGKLLLAIVIRGQNNNFENGFVTDTNDVFQVGVKTYPKLHRVKAHVHKSSKRVITSTPEFLYLISGKIRVKYYSGSVVVKTTILKSGDALLHIEGGHGFEMMEESRVIMVKQGPYLGTKEDKEYLVTE